MPQHTSSSRLKAGQRTGLLDERGFQFRAGSRDADVEKLEPERRVGVWTHAVTHRPSLTARVVFDKPASSGLFGALRKNLYPCSMLAILLFSMILQ